MLGPINSSLKRVRRASRDSIRRREDEAGRYYYDVYEDYTLADLVTLDTKLIWQPRLWSSRQGYLMVEVSNLFDQVVSTKTSRYNSVSDRYPPRPQALAGTRPALLKTAG